MTGPVRATVFAALLAGGAVFGPGCGSTDRQVTAADTRAASEASTAPTTTTIPFPSAAPYTPTSGEPAADARVQASALVQALTTYEVGGGTLEAARMRLEAAGFDPALATGSEGLLVPTAQSAGDIVYPQLGGLTDTQSSVMVVVRQRLREDGGDRAITRTLDVRLDLAGAWRPTTIASFGGAPPAEPVALSATAQRVLEAPNLWLPDTARWDVQSGAVDDRVLAALLHLSESHEVQVAVLATGHPYEVFGEGSVSNHSEGRAVDVWGIDGSPLIAQRDDPGIQQLVQGLLDTGVEELGAPWQLNGAGAFSNALHQDHVHIAFDR